MGWFHGPCFVGRLGFIDSIEVGSPLEQWAADPESRLSNDERLLTRFRIKTRATVIEIQRSVGENRCVARDLFDPGVGEFIVFHPVLGNAPRFSRHLGWYTWLPHYERGIPETLGI